MGKLPLPPMPRLPGGEAVGPAGLEKRAEAAAGNLPAQNLTAQIEEDFRLAQQLIAGDAAAWQTLVERFQRLVLARVMVTARESNHSLSQSDAEDLVADVFSRLIADHYAAIRRFEGRSTLSTWLSVITRRIVLRRLSAASREPSQPAAHPPPLDQLAGDNADEPLAAIISDEERSLLSAGMARLNERQRELAKLFYLDGQSYREISQRLNMPVNSIGPTLARIHEKLRTAMGTNLEE